MVLNRFTNIDQMFSIVRHSAMRMSDPSYWEDKNDSELLDIYRRAKGLQALFALCFTNEAETIYHWSAFSEKKDACCIEFDGMSFLSSLPKDRRFKHGRVEYLRLTELDSRLKYVDQIPFHKRFPYRNENEYRVLFETPTAVKDKFVPIHLETITKITINQHMSSELFSLIKGDIEATYGIKVSRSTVVKNDHWIKHAMKIGKLV